MIVIGERINATRKHIFAAIEKRDTKFIQDEAMNQIKSGANLIDINAGGKPDREISDMEWLVKTVREVTDVPLCIDSANPSAIELGLSLQGKAKPMINSITNEEERLNKILPLVKKYNSDVVALTIEAGGIPTTAQRRIEIAKSMITKVKDFGIPLSNVYVDPCIFPVSTDSKQAIVSMDTIRGVKQMFPEVKSVVGLSNVSYGLPARVIVNSAFLILLLSAGLDAAIIDPTEKKMMTALRAANALLDKDEYCLEYITASREGLFS